MDKPKNPRIDAIIKPADDLADRFKASEAAVRQLERSSSKSPHPIATTGGLSQPKQKSIQEPTLGGTLTTGLPSKVEEDQADERFVSSPYRAELTDAISRLRESNIKFLIGFLVAVLAIFATVVVYQTSQVDGIRNDVQSATQQLRQDIRADVQSLKEDLRDHEQRVRALEARSRPAR